MADSTLDDLLGKLGDDDKKAVNKMITDLITKKVKDATSSLSGNDSTIAAKDLEIAKYKEELDKLATSQLKSQVGNAIAKITKDEKKQKLLYNVVQHDIDAQTKFAKIDKKLTDFGKEHASFFADSQPPAPNTDSMFLGNNVPLNQNQAKPESQTYSTEQKEAYQKTIDEGLEPIY